MTSSYLDRPCRSLEEALHDRTEKRRKLAEALSGSISISPSLVQWSVSELAVSLPHTMPTLDVAALIDLLDEAARIATAATAQHETPEQEMAADEQDDRQVRRAATG